MGRRAGPAVHMTKALAPDMVMCLTKLTLLTCAGGVRLGEAASRPRASSCGRDVGHGSDEPDHSENMLRPEVQNRIAFESLCQVIVRIS
jgi:hypothetical protein